MIFINQTDGNKCILQWNISPYPSIVYLDFRYLLYHGTVLCIKVHVSRKIHTVFVNLFLNVATLLKFFFNHQN